MDSIMFLCFVLIMLLVFVCAVILGVVFVFEQIKLTIDGIMPHCGERILNKLLPLKNKCKNLNSELFEDVFSTSKMSSGNEYLDNCTRIIVLLVVCGIVGSCLEGEEYLVNNSSMASTTVAEIPIWKDNNAPVLFASKAKAEAYFLKRADKRVAMNKMRFNPDNTAIYVAFTSDTWGSVKEAKVERVELYPRNFPNGQKISISEAIAYAENFLPKHALDVYYELLESNIECYDYDSGNTKKRYYKITYTLLESKEGKNNGYPQNVGYKIEVDEDGNVEYIQVGYHLRLDSFRKAYVKRDWKPVGLYGQKTEQEKVAFAKSETKELLEQIEKSPKLLDHGQKLRVAAEVIGLPYCYIQELNGPNRRKSGERRTVIDASYKKSGDKDYVFSIKYRFDNLPERKKISLDEAVVIAETHLPMDIIKEYYKPIIVRKVLPGSKNRESDVIYKVVWELVITDESRKEIKKNGYPNNISMVIVEDEDCVSSIGLNCYRFIEDREPSSEIGIFEDWEYPF